MSDIKMIKYHQLPLAQAKQLVQQAADDLAKRYDLASEWHGNTLRFERAGVRGQMKVTPSEIDLDVTLGFLFKAFKAKFVESIEHSFDRLLTGGTKPAKAAKTANKAAKKSAKRG